MRSFEIQKIFKMCQKRYISLASLPFFIIYHAKHDITIYLLKEVKFKSFVHTYHNEIYNINTEIKIVSNTFFCEPKFSDDRNIIF